MFKSALIAAENSHRHGTPETRQPVGESLARSSQCEAELQPKRIDVFLSPRAVDQVAEIESTGSLCHRLFA